MIKEFIEKIYWELGMRLVVLGGYRDTKGVLNMARSVQFACMLPPTGIDI